MGLKAFTIDTNLLSTSKHCRLDEKYAAFTSVDNWIVFNSKYSQVPISDFLSELPIKKHKKGDLEKVVLLVNISDQNQRSGELEQVELANEIGSDKNDLSKSDIFVSKLGMPRGYIFINTYKGQDLIGSTEFIPYKVKHERYKLILKYLLLHPKMLEAYSSLESGKIPSHRRVNPYEFQKIKIPLIPKPKQDQIVAQIEPIEKKIKELKVKIKEPQEVINKVFAREFGFDLKKFEESKKEKFFEVDFSRISKNNLTRVSSHFHHIKLNFLEDKLKDKDFWISLNTKFELSGGKRVPKGKTFSNEQTGYCYLRPTEINIWGIDKNNVLYISEEIYNQLKRYKITTGEFCISIVGTLGKTALINTEELEIEDDNLILSENFIKLKTIQEVNDLFYYYYFYSFIFEAQMDREYTITSIKKLGIDKWSYIKIPNIPLKSQQKIVDEIKAKLDKQEEIKSKIESERNKIDEIIEKVIK